MTTTRRSFLHTAALAGAALGLPGPRARATASGQAAPTAAGAGGGGAAGRKTILILGGTSFLGRHAVEAAVARGHVVTLFNRGKTNPQLFPELEKLRGNRDPDQDEGIGALKGRSWDAVIDTSGYVPRIVGASAELLKDHVGQYVFVSSISVYPEFSKIGLSETDPVATMEDETIESMQYYGPLKALSEQAAEAAMPGRVTNVRPGLIVGPHDNVPRFTYWPVRVEKGGEVLAPGNPHDPVQYIDGRDLAEWMVHCIEQNITGVFNANGPNEPTNIAELLYGCKAVTGGSAQFTWVDAEFLTARDVHGWVQMPLWVPPMEGYEGFHRVDISRAVAAGLRARPLAETVRATLDWYHAFPEDEPLQLRAGISPEQEAEVLAAWHARDDDGDGEKG